MCGRFTLTVGFDEIAAAFPWVTLPAGELSLQPRYNIAPTQPVAVVPNDGENRLDFFVWGLVPSWAKDPSIGSRMINARGETIHEKPSFRSAARRRRCLILADGFYEWVQEPGQKQKTPMYVSMEDSRPFAFAGLWEQWNSPHGDELLTCTIVTTTPNAFLKSMHHRMPVILPEDAYEQWLTPEEVDPAELAPLIVPYAADDLRAYPVSQLVNSPANDLPECIVPLG